MATEKSCNQPNEGKNAYTNEEEEPIKSVHHIKIFPSNKADKDYKTIKQIEIVLIFTLSHRLKSSRSVGPKCLHNCFFSRLIYPKRIGFRNISPTKTLPFRARLDDRFVKITHRLTSKNLHRSFSKKGKEGSSTI